MECAQVEKPANAKVVCISDEDIVRLAGCRARQNNSLAKECGQTDRLKASDLIDLFYQCDGACACCSVPLTVETIQLDHIVKARYRATRASRLAGRDEEYGRIASIENVQWVCKSCNALKEMCDRNGLNLGEYATAIANQAANGFPIRSSCMHIGREASRKWREEKIKDAIRKDCYVSAMHIHESLLGTIGEASYQAIIQHMKECGWSPSRRDEWRKSRREAITNLVAQGKTEWDSWKDLAHHLESMMPCDKTFTAPTWNKDMLDLGVKFSFRSARSYLRKPCAGDKAAALAALKSFGSDGASLSELVEAISLRGVPEHLIHLAIDALVSQCAAYTRQPGNIFVASLTRKEAAKLINVTPNRLKKWACREWDGKNAGPPYMKSSEKGLTYYRHEDVEAHVMSRDATRYDLVGAKGTHEGGMLGGRPPMPGGVTVPSRSPGGPVYRDPA